MREDLRVLEQVNPIRETDADGWTGTTSGRDAFARVMERTQGDFEELVVPAKRGRQTWVYALVAALAVVVVIGVPALLLDSDGPTATPLSLGVDHVWPDEGVEGGPIDVASAFATEVLGWADASSSIEPGSDPEGRAWVVIDQEGSDPLVVETVPIGEGRTALSQVGSGIWLVVDGLDTGDGRWIAFSAPQDAFEASLHVRMADGSLDLIAIEPDVLRNEGRVPIEDDNQAVTALVVYRDASGEAIGASGARFGLIDEAETKTPREILDDGVVTVSEYYGAALAVLSCLEAEGVDAGVAFNQDGSASFTTAGEDEGVFRECHGPNMGQVELAWADQNAPSPEREIAFYNEVVDCVESQTGEEYGEVEARSDTRATDAAIADAPGVYDGCLDEVLNRYPGFGSSS